MANNAREFEGQWEFYKSLSLENHVIVDNNTDGYIKGTLFEFKKSAKSVDAALYQAIKYLSHMRLRGQPIHKNIIIVSLAKKIAYCYNSSDFIEQIERIYVGAASRGNDVFFSFIKPIKINFGAGPSEIQKLLEIIDFQNPQYTKVNIDEFCVVGWADTFYKEKSDATKIDLFNELKNPVVLKDYIYAWSGIEDDFKYVMDCLNDPQNRKELGAFYTPPAYAKKAVDLVRRAISMLPVAECFDENCEHRVEGETEHKHYIILDRCAGTGNLEEFLSDEELAHTIIATYELKEWVVLNNRIGDKVKFIIPPTPDHENGLLNDGDALAVEIFPSVKPYIDDDNCQIILFENPPYRDVAAREKNRKSNRSLIYEKFKESGTDHSMHRDLSNLFIWSGYEYYLKKSDYFVLYSPVKYWKALNISNKKFINGYLFNRKYFHASPSAISCILWKNEDEKNNEIMLQIYDIDHEEIVDLDLPPAKIKKVFKRINDFKHDDEITGEQSDIYCELDGTPSDIPLKCNRNAVYNDDIIAYLRATSFNLDGNSRALTRTITRDALEQCYGFYLLKNNFMQMLPLFVAKLYPQRNWYEKDIYFTTADGGTIYQKDENFLNACMIFTCLTKANHILSFDIQGDRLYTNELCFDAGTIASAMRKNIPLSTKETLLLAMFDDIMEIAKTTKNYRPQYKYGIYQIDKELNTYVDMPNPTTRKQERHYDNEILNGKFGPLKKELDNYYDSIILPKLLKYELLK